MYNPVDYGQFQQAPGQPSGQQRSYQEFDPQQAAAMQREFTGADPRESPIYMMSDRLHKEYPHEMPQQGIPGSYDQNQFYDSNYSKKSMGTKLGKPPKASKSKSNSQLSSTLTSKSKKKPSKKATTFLRVESSLNPEAIEEIRTVREELSNLEKDLSFIFRGFSAAVPFYKQEKYKSFQPPGSHDTSVMSKTNNSFSDVSNLGGGNTFPSPSQSKSKNKYVQNFFNKYPENNIMPKKASSAVSSPVNQVPNPIQTNTIDLDTIQTQKKHTGKGSKPNFSSQNQPNQYGSHLGENQSFGRDPVGGEYQKAEPSPMFQTNTKLMEDFSGRPEPQMFPQDHWANKTGSQYNSMAEDRHNSSELSVTSTTSSKRRLKYNEFRENFFGDIHEDRNKNTLFGASDNMRGNSKGYGNSSGSSYPFEDERLARESKFTRKKAAQLYKKK